MHRYSLFGGCLHSALELPGLPVSSEQDASWRLTIGDPADQGLTGVLIGTEEVDGGCMVRLCQQPRGLRLSYDDTGTFDVLGGGEEIVWYPAAGASEESARLDIIGRVLATAMHLGGIFPLHGSGVNVDGSAIAFVAPKTFGKSTLAMALANAGAGFLSDDTLPVEPGETPHARPGVDHVRLWNDSASRLASSGRLTTVAGGMGKHVVVMSATSPMARVPLAAVYVLAPARPAPDVPVVRRERLGAVPAALALLAHAKLGGLAGGREATRLLDQATRVARCVPVYRLEIARDLDRLEEVAALIMSWHSARLSGAQPRQDALAHAAGASRQGGREVGIPAA